MGTEILTVCDRFFSSAINGIYQGIIITALVALSLRVLSRTNAATRHAVWLCTLVLLVLIVVAHCFVDSGHSATTRSEISRTEATPMQGADIPNAAVLTATTDDTPKEIESPLQRTLVYLSASQELAPSQNPDSFQSTSTQLSGEIFLVEGFQPSDATLGEGEPNNQPTTAELFAPTTVHNRSGWFYNAMRRLANPVPLTFGLESRVVRIAGAIALCVCLTLTGVRLFVLLVRLFQIRKLKRLSIPTSEALDELFQSLVPRLGVSRKVRLRTSPTSRSSFLLGFFHPVILLPNAEQTDMEEAEQILRHELAHVCRRDDWANLLQHFILAAFPFHPAVWWISKRLSLEREIACDDYVLQSSARPQTYALLLANLAARMQRCPPLLAPGASNNKTQLQQRIDMILNTHRNTSPRLAATWLTFMAAAAALFAVTAVCLAPRIVLAQSDEVPTAANAPSDDVLNQEPVRVNLAVGLSAPTVALVAIEGASSDAASTGLPQPTAINSSPKFKPGDSRAVNLVPAVPAAPPMPGATAAPVALSPPPPKAPRAVAGLSAPAPAPAPRPGRAPRAAIAGAADSSLEERLERLEQMVQSLLARGHAAQNPYPLKQSIEKNWEIDRKEIAKIEAHAKQQADIARHHALSSEEIEKIKEHAKHEAARAADQVKRAVDAEKIARTEQKRQTKRNFKDGSQKQLDELRKQLEILERQREKLDRQIEELERSQELLEEQGNEDLDALFDASELNADSIETSRQ